MSYFLSQPQVATLVNCTFALASLALHVRELAIDLIKYHKSIEEGVFPQRSRTIPSSHEQQQQQEHPSKIQHKSLKVK